MAKEKFIVGSFADEKDVIHTVKDVRTEGHTIHDVYAPFAVHGLDKAMGLRETELHSAGFVYALCGTATAFGCISWIFCKSWPLNIGGKPHFSLPAWIPIMFELTVLFSAVGMVLTFCYLCQIAPFVKKHHFSTRAMDDKFVMVVKCGTSTDATAVKKMLVKGGADNVEEQTAEAGWWWGCYHKN